MRAIISNLFFRWEKNMLKILQVDKEYENNLKQYTKRDGVLAFVLFVIMTLIYSLLAILENNFEFVRENDLLFGCMVNIFVVAITVLFIKLGGQTLDTIGIYKGKWITSLIVGIILAIFLFSNNFLSQLMNGGSLAPIPKILMLLIYFLLVAICEEVVFRGYIGTRIYGLIRKKWLAIFVVGVLFIIMHFPYRMIAYGRTLNDLTVKNFSWIMDLFITHLVLNLIYLKTNSLYGAIIPHWMSNFAYNIILK